MAIRKIIARSIEDSAISATDIAAGSITTAKIADANVTTAKIASSVTLTTPTIDTITSAASTALTLKSAGTTAVTIDTSQNVGIGNTTPSSYNSNANKLVIGSNSAVTGMTLASGTTAAGNIFFARGTTGADAYDGYVQYAQNGQYMAFGTGGGTERMRIDSIGNLLVGTTAPFNFSAAGGGTFQTGSSDGQLFLRNSGASANFGFYLGANSSNQMRIYNQSGSGVLLTNGSTSWSSTSDERLKTDLAPIQDSLQKVSALRAVTGRFKTDEEGVSRSFLIAQDFESVFPQALDASDEDALSLKYTEVIPLLVASIKELKAINDQQAETINALTARIEALENR